MNVIKKEICKVESKILFSSLVVGKPFFIKGNAPGTLKDTLYLKTGESEAMYAGDQGGIFSRATSLRRGFDWEVIPCEICEISYMEDK